MVRPKKHLGQHFLHDRNIAAKLAGIVADEKAKHILEVGPGTGVLTRELMEKACSPEVIEIDDESVRYLQEHFPQLAGKIHELDFLNAPLHTFFSGEEFLLCGNFPYNISSQIIFKMLENRGQIPFMAGMFQLELAQRLASEMGNKVYGSVSVLLQSYYEVKLEFKIPPGVFFPPPKVDSAVISCRRKTVLPSCTYDSLSQVVKAAFGQRRKTLNNALKKIMHPLRDELPGHFLNLRAEQISPLQFQEFAAVLDVLKSR